MNTKGYSFSWAILALLAGITGLLGWSVWTWSSIVLRELAAKHAANADDERMIARDAKGIGRRQLGQFGLLV